MKHIRSGLAWVVIMSLFAPQAFSLAETQEPVSTDTLTETTQTVEPGEPTVSTEATPQGLPGKKRRSCAW
jgi:hypothetical protein